MQKPLAVIISFHVSIKLFCFEAGVGKWSNSAFDFLSCSSTHLLQSSLCKDPIDFGPPLLGRHVVFHIFSSLQSRFFLSLYTEVATIFSLLSSRVVSALSFRSRTIRRFHALNTVSSFGHVLSRTIARVETVQARGTLASIQMGFLKVRHRSHWDYANPSSFTRATFIDSQRKN